jgi:glycosyltransferase involved in cell wall biosynthesis
MKVTVCCPGRFHAFDLAYQLQQRGALARLITTYPKWMVRKYGVSDRNAATCPPIEISKRLAMRFRGRFPGTWNAQLLISSAFDGFSRISQAADADVIVSFSGSALWTIRRGLRNGLLTILERGSTHMTFQTDILKEEYCLHGLSFDETHPGIVRRELQEYDEAEFISLPSTFAKRTFLAHGVPERRLIQVPYGVTTDEFYALPKADNIFRVIHCGQVTLRKGVQYLIRAFVELNLPKSELLFVGPVNRATMQLIEPYRRPNIKFLGPQPQSRLREFYSQANVFCLASIEEGLALVQAQAMACGLPVIATPNTGAEDLITDGVHGFIIPIRDVTALKERIGWCFQNSARCREMGAEARDHVRNRFTWELYGERIFSEYKRAFREKHAGKT